MFSITPGPTENGFYWDEEEERWRGIVIGYREMRWGEPWSPRRLFDPEDDED